MLHLEETYTKTDQAKAKLGLAVTSGNGKSKPQKALWMPHKVLPSSLLVALSLLDYYPTQVNQVLSPLSHFHFPYPLFSLSPLFSLKIPVWLMQ